MILTQISGKYSEENALLFNFKSELETKGCTVTYPKGYKILAYNSEGIGLTYDPNVLKISFYQSEILFFESIENCTFHTLYNKMGDMAYIGKSSLVETLFAMLCSKPIVIATKEILWSNGISDNIKIIIHKNVEKFFIYHRDNELPKNVVNYNILFEEKLIIYELINNLFKNYKNMS